MTTPARYCCTLQQSKRLRELGVDSPSMFYWRLISEPIGYKCNNEYWELGYDKPFKCIKESYPAYTVGELLEIIPHTKGDSLLCIMPPNEGNEYMWTCLYLPIGTAIADHIGDDYMDGNTLAECLADFYIAGLESGEIPHPHK